MKNMNDNLCFLFLFSSFALSAFLCWSAGFMNRPDLVVWFERFPMITTGIGHNYTSKLSEIHGTTHGKWKKQQQNINIR